MEILNTSILTSEKLYQHIESLRKNSDAIIYLNIDDVKIINGSKYSLQVNLMRNIAIKDKNKQVKQFPFLPPFQNGLYIIQLGDSHRLLFNKFSIYKNHVLVVSVKFQQQTEKLSEKDFLATLTVQKALKGIYYYNSGNQSGASQKHRHIQLLPAESKQLNFASLINNFLNQSQIAFNKIYQLQYFDFLHGVIFLNQKEDFAIQAKNLSQAYQLLWQTIIKRKGISYNLVGTQKFILLVPRWKEKAFNDMSINGVGFAGSILLKNEKQFDLTSQIKPEDIFSEITFKNQQALDQFFIQ